MNRLAIVAAAVAALLLTSVRPDPALAARWEFTNEYGQVCEGNLEPSMEYPTLGKVVCRNPQNFGDYGICYFDVDRRVQMIFMDCFVPVQPGSSVFSIVQQQITFSEFERRFGVQVY